MENGLASDDNAIHRGKGVLRSCLPALRQACHEITPICGLSDPRQMKDRPDDVVPRRTSWTTALHQHRHGAANGPRAERVLPIGFQPCRVWLLPIVLRRGICHGAERVLPIRHQPCGGRLLPHGWAHRIYAKPAWFLPIWHQPCRRRVLQGAIN